MTPAATQDASSRYTFALPVLLPHYPSHSVSLIMDLLYFDPNWSVLLCTHCQYALVPGAVAAHLNSDPHKDAVTPAQAKACAETWNAVALQPPKLVQQQEIPCLTQQIPHLALHCDGIACRLCPVQQPYICRSQKGMQRHLRSQHNWQSPQGKGRYSVAARLAKTAYSKLVISPVCCQTFYQQSQFIRFFQVAPLRLSAGTAAAAAAGREQYAGTAEAGQSTSLPTSLREQVVQQLDYKLQALQALLESAQADGLDTRHATQADAWLDKTMWEKYLRGHELRAAAQLAELPLQQSPSPSLSPSRSGIGSGGRADGHLSLLLASFDRLIEQTRAFIIQDEVNAFDLHRVNNFVPRCSSIEVIMSKLERRVTMRPLLSNLQEGTYKKYKLVWKRLICFVYRLVHQRQQPALHHALTNAQSAALERLVVAAQAVVDSSSSIGLRQRPGLLEQLQAELDLACLRFCITLLDHCLMGPIYDSVVVGFLAVQGINVQKNCFYNATCYTTHLSALVKMAQLLVLRQAIAAKEAGECEHPAQALEEMQERFMVYNTRSPMNWIQKLRTYGKKIRDATTDLGFIVWSDDGERLSYLGLELGMAQLRRFMRKQLDLAQAQLEEILLLHPNEGREGVVPALCLADLKDNPMAIQPNRP